MSFLSLLWDSFCVNLLVIFLGLSLFSIILSHSFLEGFSALTQSDMFNSDMESFGNNVSSDLLIDDYSDSMLVDIKDSTSFTMIEFMGHTFMNTTISYNINYVSKSVWCHYSWKRYCSVFTESFCEQMSCSCSLSMGVRHLFFTLLIYLIYNLKKYIY